MKQRTTRLGRTPVGAAALTTVVLLAGLLSAATPASAHQTERNAARAAQAQGSPKVLTRNRLYRIKTVGDAGCTPPVGATLDTTANLTAYYKTELACLQKTWGKKVKKVGVRFRSARVNVYDGAAKKSPCGKLNLSFYCGRNRTIYMKSAEIVAPWNQGAGDAFSQGLTQLAATHTLAHEFGHHLQQLSGILQASYPWTGTRGSRLELQASCLGNVFMAANATSYPVSPTYLEAQWEQYWRFIYHSGHGTIDNQRTWTQAGFASVSPKACNTWKAKNGSVR